jgi:hypothetical protein
MFETLLAGHRIPSSLRTAVWVADRETGSRPAMPLSPLPS